MNQIGILKAESNPVKNGELNQGKQGGSNQAKYGGKNQINHGGQNGTADINEVAIIRCLTAQWEGY